MPEHPDEAHAIIRKARQQAPIAIGPHGPELLTYELVRNMLRDPRFRVPQGHVPCRPRHHVRPVMGPGRHEPDHASTALNTTGYADWCRRLSHPEPPRRLRATIVDVITELVDRYSAHGRCDVVTDIAREYPIPIICALLGAPPRTGSCSRTGPTTSSRLFSWNVAAHESAILAAWDELDAYIDDMVAHRRHTLTDDLISGADPRRRRR